MTQKINVKSEYLFEASWEVCNKVGGIYTVVKTKAAPMQEHYKNYTLIGPYFKEKAKLELNDQEPPKEFNEAFKILKEEGIHCHYGSWNIKSEPSTILIEFTGAKGQINEIKSQLWNYAKVDSLGSAWEFDEPVLWSWCVGRLIEEIAKRLPGKKISSHWHEWLAGAGLLYLRSKKSDVKTVFTTHATMLGRTLAGNGRNLYEELPHINPDTEAYRYNIQSKFTLERASAHHAHVFTTVSEITGIEAEKILGRKPEILVLNGLDIQKFPTLEENTIKHVTSREIIREFLTFHFFPHYAFNLDHALFFFIVGRYEYRNKGIDLFLKALAKLNIKLTEEKSDRTICAFFWIPQPNQGLQIQLLENKNYYQHIKYVVQANSKDLLRKIVSDFVSQEDPLKESIFTKSFLDEMKKDILHFKRLGNPLICTHKLNDESRDAIFQNLLHAGLDNKEDDRVKVIYNPVYLDGSDQLLNLAYYDAMAGCHFGVFPSYYEPWGYTPLEAMALGVPALTTDLAGFGRYMDKELEKLRTNQKVMGMNVVKRFQKSDEEVVEQIFEILYAMSQMSHKERVQIKIQAKNLSNLSDWGNFVKNYINAHNLAFEK